jgi:Flp pilus assembly protein TadG
MPRHTVTPSQPVPKGAANKRTRNGRNRNGRRGSSFVEAAFVFIPLMAVIVAIFDYSLVIMTRSTLQHAVREGLRYAITYQTSPGMGHDESIREVVKNNALGFLNSVNGTENPCKICIRYYDPSTLAFTNANSPGNVIEVAVENHTWYWIAPLMRSSTPLQITVRASDRTEALPPGTLTPTR